MCNRTAEQGRIPQGQQLGSFHVSPNASKPERLCAENESRYLSLDWPDAAEELMTHCPTQDQFH